MSKRKSIFNRITTLMLLAVIALTEVGFPTQAFAKKIVIIEHFYYKKQRCDAYIG